VGERRSPTALCGEAFEHEDRAHHGRGDDEREAERGRRDEDVEDSRDRGPMIAGDGDGQGAAEEVPVRDGVTKAMASTRAVDPASAAASAGSRAPSSAGTRRARRAAPRKDTRATPASRMAAGISPARAPVAGPTDVERARRRAPGELDGRERKPSSVNVDKPAETRELCLPVVRTDATRVAEIARRSSRATWRSWPRSSFPPSGQRSTSPPRRPVGGGPLRGGHDGVAWSTRSGRAPP
jgi:hypothetical protein